MNKLIKQLKSSDGTEKYIFKNLLGTIEISKIKNKTGIDVLCLPTFYYCSMGCRFCHLTTHKVNKPDPIHISYIDLQECLKQIPQTEDKVLYSFMGCGEPTLNPQLIIDTYNNSKYRYASLAAASIFPSELVVRHFINSITRANVPLRLHLSLHDSKEWVRPFIIPGSKVYTKDCFSLLSSYQTAAQDHKKNMKVFHSTNSLIMIYYTLIKNINDDDLQLKKLIEYTKDFKIPVKIIEFNELEDEDEKLERSNRAKIWLESLNKEIPGIASYYIPPGRDIGSSCGQFDLEEYCS